MTAYRAIALDVGGVIYYDEPFDLAWIHEVLGRAQAADPSFTLPDLIRDMTAFYGAGRQPRDRSNTVFSQPPARESWLAVRRRWNMLVQPIPGAADAVRQLAQRHNVCVVANQPPECVEALGRLGIGDVLQPVALDSVVGYAKPDPRLLDWTLSRLGCPPAETLVVGNRWDHDIVPAQALGCPATLIRPDDGWSPPLGSHPDIVTTYRSLRVQSSSPPILRDTVSVVGSLAVLVPAFIRPLDHARPA
jgi:FMN phosphatase YigB (HAD superfamily)